MENKWIEMIIDILVGLAAITPLVVYLVRYVIKAVKERNWVQLLTKLMELMKVAEEKFQTGAERKEWVLAMLEASADEINYPIDYAAIGDLIDALCALSKVVNVDNMPSEDTDMVEV